MVTSGPPVFLFIGSERYLKESALEKLKSSLRSTPLEEIDLKVFYGSDSTASQIVGHAQAFPLFSSKKLIVIKEFNKLPKDDRSRFAEYVRNPAKSTYLVIDIDGDDTPKELTGESKHFKTVAFNSPSTGRAFELDH
jgi:DNA polymerase III subunit delta